MDTKNRKILRNYAMLFLGAALWLGGFAAAWADAPFDQICPLPAASAPFGSSPAKCEPAKQIPKTPTVHAPQPAPSDVHQQTTVYCGATAPAAASSALAVPKPAVPTPPAEACNKEPDAGVTKISVKLTKDIGLNLESGNKTIGYLGLFIFAALVVLAIWIGKNALRQTRAEGGSPLLAVGLVCLALVGIGTVFLGYWWKTEVQTTLTADQTNTLLTSPVFQTALNQAALKDLAEANEDRARLRSRAAELEKELAVTQANAASSGAAVSTTSPLRELLYLVLGGALGLSLVGFTAHASRARVLELETVLASIRAALESPRQDNPMKERWERLAINIANRILDSVRSFKGF